jgi:hypothetical protein
METLYGKRGKNVCDRNPFKRRADTEYEINKDDLEKS